MLLLLVTVLLPLWRSLPLLAKLRMRCISSAGFGGENIRSLGLLAIPGAAATPDACMLALFTRGGFCVAAGGTSVATLLLLLLSCTTRRVLLLEDMTRVPRERGWCSADSVRVCAGAELEVAQPPPPPPPLASTVPVACCLCTLCTPGVAVCCPAAAVLPAHGWELWAGARQCSLCVLGHAPHGASSSIGSDSAGSKCSCCPAILWLC